MHEWISYKRLLSVFLTSFIGETMFDCYRSLIYYLCCQLSSTNEQIWRLKVLEDSTVFTI